MLHGCKVAKPSPAPLARTQPHISKSLLSDTPWRETTPILLQFDKYCCISVHMTRGPPWRGMHGDYHRWGGEPIDWRSTVNSFRQHIKVLQQLLRVPRLKSEQSQAHRGLLLLPGKWILLRVPRINHAFSLRPSQSHSRYFISVHQEGIFLC